MLLLKLVIYWSILIKVDQKALYIYIEIINQKNSIFRSYFLEKNSNLWAYIYIKYKLEKL